MAKKYGPEDEWTEKVKSSKKETSHMSLSEAEKKIAEFREKLDL